MPTDIKGKKVAIIGKFLCHSTTALQLHIGRRGALITNTHLGLDILLVGQGGENNSLLDAVRRRNNFLKLGPKPKTVELWDERRVAGEFGEGTTSLAGKSVAVLDNGVARALLCSLIEARGGTIVSEGQQHDILVSQRALDSYTNTSAEIWGSVRLAEEFGPDAG